MASVRRRALGFVLFVLAAVCFAQPVMLRSTLVDAGAPTPTFGEPGSLIVLVPPAAVAAGSIIVVAAVSALRGRTLAPRGSLAAPAIGVFAGVALGIDVGVDEVSMAAITLSGTTSFVVTGAVVGGSLAPVVLGATRGDTVSLLLGTILVLAGVSVAPAPGFALLAGALGGGLAIGLAWGVDAASWAPS